MLEKRFGSLQDTEKRKLMATYSNLRISGGQTFRQFYNKLEDVTIKLKTNQNVPIHSDWHSHKISMNVPANLRAYYCSIQHNIMTLRNWHFS